MWVDAISFETLASEALQRLEHGDAVEGLRLARRARGLYRGDLCPDESGVDVFVVERERFRLLHIDLHAAAAAAACDLGWMRKAIRWARWTLELDPGCERAYRVMMRAHALLGETERAQRAYDQCRRALADEFGVDPSPETEAAHLELLRLPQAAPRLPFVGRAETLALVRTAVRSAREAGSGLAVIVGGAPGAGRTRFAQEVCAAANLRLEHFDIASAGGKELVASVSRMTGHAGPAALLVEGLHTDPPCLLALRAAITRAGPGQVLFATVPPLSSAGDAIRQLVDGLADSCHGVHVELGPLTPGQAAELAAAALGGRPDPALLNQLLDASGGLPGPLAKELARMRGSVAPGTGAQPFVTAQRGDDGDDASRLERFRALLTPAQEHAIQFASVVGEVFSHRHLDALAGIRNRELEQAVDALEDYGYILRDGERYRFASRVLYDAVYEWVSPSVRRRLHAAVAEWPDLTDDDRLDHWLRAGETRRACSTALAASRLARSQGRYRDARRLLISVLGLAHSGEVDTSARIELLEELAGACEATRSVPEARAALDEAIELAIGNHTGALPRLYRRRGDVELPTSAVTADAGNWYQRALAVGYQPVAETIRTKLAIGSMMALRTPKAAEQVLTEARVMADEAGDTEAQVAARSRLARMVLVPQRRLLAAREQAGQAVLLAEGTGNPALLATALLRRWEPELWLGSEPPVEPLRRAWRLALDSGDGLLQSETELMLCLALHDGGDPAFVDLWPQVWPQVKRPRGERAWRWVAVKVLTERGLFASAAAQAAHCRNVWEGPAPSQLVRLHAAVLSAARGAWTDATQRLRTIVHDSATTNVTALVPEVAARLAALEAAHEPLAAQQHLDAAQRLAAGDTSLRERWALLLGRSRALAAQGVLDTAADLAGAAALVARAGSLPFLQAEALVVRADLLSFTGARQDADQTFDEARLIFRRCNAPARVRHVERVRAELREGHRRHFKRVRQAPRVARAAHGGRESG